MKKILPIGLLALASFAQTPVAPTEAPLGPPRGEDLDGYNVVNSFELGYRWHDVNGDIGKYRSDVNFRNGMRLLSSRLSVHSKEGQGKYFDELLLNTQGLGNDPYQFSSFRIQKNRLYKYDLLWRSNQYFNPALPISGGSHLIDTTRRLQDHGLTLLPQAPIRLHVGYSNWAQSGPALSTVQLFDSPGDQFALNTDVRRSQNEYRLGFDVNVAGFKLTAVRAWEFFKDDTRRTLPGASAGFDPLDRTAVSSFRRDEPYHGSTKSWRLNLLADRSNFVTLNGRFVYAAGERDFIFDESATGIDRFGTARNRQILVFGSGRRPVSAGSLTTTIYPLRDLTISNHTAFHHTRMEGDGGYRELANATLDFEEVRFNFLGIRTISTATDASYKAHEHATFFLGHQYSARRVRSIEQTVFDGFPDTVPGEQDSHLNSGRAGVRLRAFKRLSLLVDGEIGRVDRPIYPTSERNYHAIGGRLQYKTRTLSASALVRTNYNVNSESLFSHSSKARNYSADLSWSPTAWGGLDASYSKIHLDTLSGIAYFYQGALTRDNSIYFSNIHAASLMGRASIRNRVDLFLGYTRVQDAGAPDERGAASYATVPGIIGFQELPLTYDSPLARVSVRLHNKLRFNVGYQFYRYQEERLLRQNYRAHTGFTSLMWTF